MDLFRIGAPDLMFYWIAIGSFVVFVLAQVPAWLGDIARKKRK